MFRSSCSLRRAGRTAPGVRGGSIARSTLRPSPCRPACIRDAYRPTGDDQNTEIFGLRCFITPTVPRGIDVLVVHHIIPYYNTLTHNMLHFNGIKKSLYDFQNISSFYWKRRTLPCQLSLDGTDATEVNSILRQDQVRQGCILIPNLFNLYTDPLSRFIQSLDSAD